MAEGRSHVVEGALLVIAVVAVLWALEWLEPVLVPFVLAVFLTFALTPIVNLLRVRLKVGRPFAVILSFALGLGLLAVLGVIVAQSADTIQNNIPAYQARLTELLDDAQARIEHLLAKDDGPVEAAPEPAVPRVASLDEPAEPGFNLAESLTANIRASVGTVAGATASALLDIISQGLIVAIFMLFLLTGRATVAAAPPAGGSTLAEIETRIQNYVLLKTVISIITGGMQGLVLWACGVELALLWGFLGFLFNFIPNIGPVLAVLAPLPIVALSPDWAAGMRGSWQIGLVGIAMSAGVHFTSGNYFEPKVMGDRFKMHPVAILIGLMFFGMIWGIVGAFLSTPIVAVVKILCDKSTIGRPFGQLIAGRLEPIEHATRQR